MRGSYARVVPRFRLRMSDTRCRWQPPVPNRARQNIRAPRRTAYLPSTTTRSHSSMTIQQTYKDVVPDPVGKGMVTWTKKTRASRVLRRPRRIPAAFLSAIGAKDLLTNPRETANRTSPFASGFHQSRNLRCHPDPVARRSTLNPSSRLSANRPGDSRRYRDQLPAGHHRSRGR